MAIETQEIIQREAPDIEALKLGLMKQAQALVSAPPIGGLPSLEIAGLDPLQAQAAAVAQAGIGAYKPFLTEGQQAILAGQGATLGGLGAYDPTAVTQFLDPFTQAVIEQTERDIERQGQLQTRAFMAKVADRGTWGNRTGLERAEIGRNVLDQQAKTAAQLRTAGFGQAQKASMQAYEEAQRRDLAAGQLFGKLGTQSGALGELAVTLPGREATLLAGLGKEQRGITQAQLGAERATALQNIYEPYQRLGFYSDILRGAPSTQQTLSTATFPEPSLMNQLVGGGIAGINLASAAGKAGII